MRRAVLSFGMIYSFCCVPFLCAQTPSVPLRCNVPAKSKSTDSSSPKVVIDDVTFGGPIDLPNSAITAAVADANKRNWRADDSNWVQEFAETGLRSAWQDRGYFRVILTSIDAQPVGTDAATEHFLVAAQVNEGPQYRTGDLRFATRSGAVPVFSDAELSSVFPLHEGDLFDVSKVRAGMVALKKLYASQGYIDFTVEPQTEIDNSHQRVSALLVLDEQKQYLVDKVEVLGSDPALESELRAILPPGQIFNDEALENFYDRNTSALPFRFREGTQYVRDAKAGTVDLAFDFRPCPSH